MGNNDLLPPQFRAKMENTVLEGLRDALRLLEPESWLSLAPAVSSEILDSVKTVISSELAALNTRQSLQSRLPAEVWCNVWELLPYFDRVAVTQVCSHWRALALQCPVLWTRVTFYTSLHSSKCCCRACPPERYTRSSHDGLLHLTGWEASPYPKRSSNMHVAPSVLSRSCNLPLDVELDIVPYDPDQSVLRAFATHLSPHSSRIRRLRIRATRPTSLDAFLIDSASLPSLRELCVDGLPYGLAGGLAGTTSFLKEYFSFPRLQELRLPSPCIRWASDKIQLNLPTVSLLVICPLEIKEVVQALTACPAVKSLEVDLSFLRSTAIGELAHLRRPLDDLVLRNMKNSNTHDELSKLLSCDHRSVSVHSEHVPGYLPHIFSDLGDAVHASLVHRESNITIQAVDRDGKTRRLTIPQSQGKMIWMCFGGSSSSAALQYDSIIRLSIDASLWRKFSAKFWRGPSVRTLEITIHDANAVLRLPPTPPEELATAQSWLPSLQTLALVVDSEAPLSLAAQDIATFVRKTGIFLPVATLALDKSFFPCDDGLFSGLAENVVLQ